MDAGPKQAISNSQNQNPAKEEENQHQTQIQEESNQDQNKSGVQAEDQIVAQDRTVRFGPIAGMDGEDLIFSDEAFTSLPDFRCLSSPSPTPSPTSAAQHQKSVSTSASSSSSSSSRSSSWPFLRVPDSTPGSLPECKSEMLMQPQPLVSDPTSEMQIEIDFGGVDEFDLSVPWDPAELSLDEILKVHEPGACTDQPFNLDLPCPGFDDMKTNSAVEAEEEEGEDLAKFFLEWLKNNKDAISPEDLRSIRLKRSTIECAAQRLGADRRGHKQLVKLILSWVQNHHLQRKKARLQEAEQLHGNAWVNPTQVFNQVPIESVPNPNPSLNMDFDMGQPANGCNTWFQATDPYSVNQSCTTNTAVVNGPLFSPVSDLHAADPNMSWDQSYNMAFQGYPMTYQTGIQPSQYGVAPVNPLYHQGQSMGSMASATREARKKRMARQRRVMSLQQSRAMGQSGNPVQCGFVGNSINRNWAFWPSLGANSQQGKGMMDMSFQPGASSSISQTKQIMHGSGQHDQRSMLRPGASTSDRRKGIKSHDKNLRFLLQKVLKQSDVGSLGRIVLPKKEAEIYLPELDSRDGITIPMEDVGTSCVWNMRYRFWPNNKSRMYLLENTGDFVRLNGLEEGDFIVIYSDMKSGKYMIRGVKVKKSQEKGRDMAEEKRVNSEKNKALN